MSGPDPDARAGSERAPSSLLLAGRRALDALPGVSLLRDWRWVEGADVSTTRWPQGAWSLHCAITLDIGLPTDRVPRRTEWYVLVDPRYPRGDIKFYPAVAGGIQRTFQHQDYNMPYPSGVAWCSGGLCLDTAVQALGQHGGDWEPDDADGRLAWHFERAIGWLELAAQGLLAVRADWFELPQFPVATRDVRVVFSEGARSLALWKGVHDRVGLVDFSLMPRGAALFVVRHFRSLAGHTLFAPEWGSTLAGAPLDPRVGVWVCLDAVPVLDVWHPPFTWQELRRLWFRQGHSIGELLRPVAHLLRDGRAHIALLGFPIPAKVGGEPTLMHWQAVQLPVLTQPGREVPRRGRRDVSGRWYVPRDPCVPDGFRPGEKAYWHRDMVRVLNGSTPVNWLKSENWHADQISTRGRFREPLRSSRVLLLGAGALGCAVGEMLVRSGVHQVTVMDGDHFEAGNLVRHSLTLSDLGEQKASALARRLNQVSPHARVDAIDAPFPPLSEEGRARVRTCDIVLNCTADREVLHHLEAFEWDHPVLFACLSVGRGATRLYCFTAYGSEFPRERFAKMLEPWASVPVPPAHDQEAAGGHSDENGGATDDEMPWEGVGCWHPVFPARADDIMLMAAAAIKRLDDVVGKGVVEPSLAVFEQQRADGFFQGVRQIELGVACA